MRPGEDETRVSVHLYSPHDIDLITLLYLPGFPFRKAFYEAVKRFAEGRDMDKVSVPESFDYPDYQHRREHRIMLFFRDEQTKALLDSIQPRYRNAAVKNIFRFMMDRPVIPCGITEGLPHEAQENKSEARPERAVSKPERPASSETRVSPRPASHSSQGTSPENDTRPAPAAPAPETRPEDTDPLDLIQGLF